MINLGGLIILGCVAVKFTSNGKTTTVWHTCSDPNCPKKK